MEDSINDREEGEMTNTPSGPSEKPNSRPIYTNSNDNMHKASYAKQPFNALPAQNEHNSPNQFVAPPVHSLLHEEPAPVSSPRQDQAYGGRGRGGRSGSRGGRFNSGFWGTSWLGLRKDDFDNFDFPPFNPSTSTRSNLNICPPLTAMSMRVDGRRTDVRPDLMASVKDPRLKLCKDSVCFLVM